MTAYAETWHRNRQTHHWVSLDGEDYACNDCDTSIGSEPCPGQPFASKTERETPGTDIIHTGTYEHDTIGE